MELIGIDVGGTGIKAAVVETTTGELVTARVRVETPHPARPKAVVKATAGLVAELPAALHAGIGFPAVILDGVVKTAANIDRSWIDTQADSLFADALDRRLADRERRRCRGPGRDALRRGPRAGGHRAHADARNGHRVGALPRRRPAPEHRARAPAGAGQGRRAARRRVQGVSKGLSWHAWSKLLAEYVDALDALLWPDLVIIGGGISKEADKFIHDLPSRVKCVPAALQNQAGIVGAACSPPRRRGSPRRRPPRVPPRWRAWRRRWRRGHERDRQGLPADRGSRHHRQPPHGGARRQRGHDRLVLPRALRRPQHVRLDPRLRLRRQLLAPARRGELRDEAALPPGHRRAGHALLHRGRRRGDHRLHAARGQQLLDRAPHRGRARVRALPRRLPARVRLRARAAPAGGRRTTGDLPRGGQHVRAAIGDGRARGSRGHGRRRADARPRRVRVVRALRGQARPGVGRGIRRRRLPRDRRLLAPVDRPEHAIADAGASSSTARRSRSSC